MNKIVTLMILASLVFACNSKKSEEKIVAKTETTTNKIENGKLQVYYFHYTRRCETCKNVEMLAKDVATTTFGDKTTFEALNIEENYGEQVANKLGVNEQKLLIIKGEKQIDLTNEAFLYASDQPDKFKEIMEKKLNELLQ